MVRYFKRILKMRANERFEDENEVYNNSKQIEDKELKTIKMFSLS